MHATRHRSHSTTSTTLELELYVERQTRRVAWCGAGHGAAWCGGAGVGCVAGWEQGSSTSGRKRCLKKEEGVKAACADARLQQEAHAYREWGSMAPRNKWGLIREDENNEVENGCGVNNGRRTMAWTEQYGEGGCSIPHPAEEQAVWAVSGRRADLPCTPDPREADDQPVLVLWYRAGDTLQPVFRSGWHIMTCSVKQLFHHGTYGFSYATSLLF
ncbi:hypothetical protein E2C01_037279 [Portunus trituberculatus]|uniref:Ig-like domain-containing protein n=1 Tax=Portunus trituberculatus TaxID=210409 RepID=A0A5B7FDK4_PORTR|nr:hypothetical protein [Portunus trituberculatus]